MERLGKGKQPDEVARTVMRLLLPYKHAVRTIIIDDGTEFFLIILLTYCWDCEDY